MRSGRSAGSPGTEIWPDAIYEIEKDSPTTGNVVWEWRVWDHLIQDVDPGLPVVS